jgi:hypothetical protein
MSTTTTRNGNSLLAVAPAAFPTVFVEARAESSNANDSSADNTRVMPNPPDWPTEYRRVPHHRPTNTNLDSAERPYGANSIEWLIGQFIMVGVLVQSVSDRRAVYVDFFAEIIQNYTKAWEATGYRWWPGLTLHKIGGEW